MTLLYVSHACVFDNFVFFFFFTFHIFLLVSAAAATLDKCLNQAAKVLRLLHIAELRQLQTSINEIIVTVQTITANPKTDERLGKVGR